MKYGTSKLIKTYTINWIFDRRPEVMRVWIIPMKYYYIVWRNRINYNKYVYIIYVGTLFFLSIDDIILYYIPLSQFIIQYDRMYIYFFFICFRLKLKLKLINYTSVWYFFFVLKSDKDVNGSNQLLMVLILWRVDAPERTTDDRHPDEESDT